MSRINRSPQTNPQQIKKTESKTLFKQIKIAIHKPHPKNNMPHVGAMLTKL